MQTLLPQAVGWYGKLPTRGDFVGRGLPRPWLRVWDDWLQQGLAAAGQHLGSARLRERLLAMPPWQCLVLPSGAGQPVWSGVVTPATDRVGRVFPLLLAEAYDPAALDRAGLKQLQARALYAADWLDRVGALSSPKEFEAGAAQLGATAWRCAPAAAAGEDAGTVADLRAAWPTSASFWWRPEPVGAMPAPLAEGWPPRDALILHWLGEAG